MKELEPIKKMNGKINLRTKKRCEFLQRRMDELFDGEIESNGK